MSINACKTIVLNFTEWTKLTFEIKEQKILINLHNVERF